MSEHVTADKMAMPEKQDFSRNITLIAVILKSTFCSEVIKAMNVVDVGSMY